MTDIELLEQAAKAGGALQFDDDSTTHEGWADPLKNL